MSIYHAYTVGPAGRILNSQASVVADTSFDARRAYCAAVGADLLSVIAIREDLDDRTRDGEPAPTELRWIRAYVRLEGSLGNFTERDFQVTVPITGSYDRMAKAAIAGIRAQGYETLRITAQSTKRELL